MKTTGQREKGKGPLETRCPLRATLIMGAADHRPVISNALSEAQAEGALEEKALFTQL